MNYLIITIIAILALGLFNYGNASNKWIAYYANKANMDDFKEYDIIVFESDSHPAIRQLTDRGKTVLGYLSIGEVHKERPYFKLLKDTGLLMGENKNWKDSFYVDITSKEWVKIVIEEIIPRILHDGFDGIFIDTADSIENLSDIRKYNKARKSLVNLIQTIKFHYPDIDIYLNRGFRIAEDIIFEIDGIVAESILTNYDFEEKSHYFVSLEEYERDVNFLKKLQSKNNSLKVLTLDYWYENEHSRIKEIYSTQRDSGFTPYVSTIDLNKIVKEPK